MRYKYIEKIWNNVKSVDKSSLMELYEVLRDADCLIPYGSGRSYSAIKIPMSQYAKMFESPTIITPEDIGFPGNNMYEALRILKTKYRSIYLIINSGSGESEEPLAVAYDFARYMDDYKPDSMRIIGITSNPNSSLGRLASKYGFNVILKGRLMKEETLDYLTTGIMGDTFELGSLFMLQGIVKAIYYGDFSKLDKIYSEYYSKITKIIDEYVDSDMYEEIITILERRNNVFIGGRGSAHEVATMTVIRLNHVKYAIGDHVYRARGSNTPRPRPGDLGILISYSGETPAVIRWCKHLRDAKANVVAIVGNEKSTLAKMADYTFYIETEECYQGMPRDFYMYASFFLSPMPIKLIERFKSNGLKLPESLLRYYHSTVE